MALPSSPASPPRKRWRPALDLHAQSWLFSIKSFGAACLALYLAFRLDLPSPGTALTTVYIVAAPLAAAGRSKTLYRTLGTLLGAAGMIALVPNLANAPELLSLALSLWTGACLFLSILDRTPRGYIFILAGYTAALIGFPSVYHPDQTFQNALVRVQEILLGLTCSTLVHSVVFPKALAPVLTLRFRAFLQNARSWSIDVLHGKPDQALERERRSLATQATELHMLATHLPFDTQASSHRVRVANALQARITALLPLVAAIENRLEALCKDGEALDPDLAALLDETAAWLEQPPGTQAAERERLETRCQLLTPAIHAQSSWHDMLRFSLLARLADFLRLLHDCTLLTEDLIAHRTRLTGKLRAAVRTSRSRRLHRDYGLAAISAGICVATLAMGCAIWIATGWSDGATAVSMAAVLASIYASQDDPSPGIKTWLVILGAGFPVALIYLLFILPAIDTYALLMLVLAPLLLVIGLVQGTPRWSARALPLLIAVTGPLTLAEHVSVDVVGQLNSLVAKMLGIALALTATRLLRDAGPGWSAERLLHQVYSELAKLAIKQRPRERDRWLSLSLDRLGLLTSRLAAAPARFAAGGQQAKGAAWGRSTAADAQNDVRIGLNVAALQQTRRSFARPTREAIDCALARISTHYDRLARGQNDIPAESLAQHIDPALRGVCSAPLSEARQQAVLALVGLRRYLAPEAPPYAPPPADPAPENTATRE